jgi:CHAT domain-containing protein
VYLVEEHSTQRIPSAFSLVAPASKARAGAFLGIGDGIYNTADPRWTSRHIRTAPSASTPQLARLPASGTELVSSAREWRSSTNELLTGLNASNRAFRSAVRLRPAVIHIAAHVLQPYDNPEQAVIYLGLSRGGSEETLTQNEIAKLNVHAATVVMSGCNSGGLDPVPGAAILGLSRAWLAAGARAVVGSRWATPDDTGELFRVFYRDLRDRCDRGADGRVIGASLRQAQLAMLHSTTWRSNPSYWAAFYVVGKE